MKRYLIRTKFKKLLSDTITPVSIYLKIRDRYANSLLLESSDYRANQNSFSFICFNPIATITAQNGLVTKTFPENRKEQTKLSKTLSLQEEITRFAAAFEPDKHEIKITKNGLFGYLAYDAVAHFENIEIHKKEGDLGIPECIYGVYRNVIAVDHFKNETYVFHHGLDEEADNIDEIEQLLQIHNVPSYKFSTRGDVESNLTDNEFLDHVDKAREHCFRGDVFQLVLSRRFSQAFVGDEFNVYRALRSINPSPYLFFFDYGNFKIFGSSPESQLVVKDRKAEIHPIAGTFRRTGNDLNDTELAKQLMLDKKENAEHAMLVDLARNDLSRHGEHVTVETYREIQFFSHVIHLVSKVTANVFENAQTMDIVADTFPAGTLSGAPKHMAMKLIEKYEVSNRSFYGGAIGFMDFSGNYNHAIMIRTFLSKNFRLYYQAGAGIVSQSVPESELQEVQNKLLALNSALKLAETL